MVPDKKRKVTFVQEVERTTAYVQLNAGTKIGRAAASHLAKVLQTVKQVLCDDPDDAGRQCVRDALAADSPGPLLALLHKAAAAAHGTQPQRTPNQPSQQPIGPQPRPRQPGTQPAAKQGQASGTAAAVLAPAAQPLLSDPSLEGVTQLLTKLCHEQDGTVYATAVLQYFKFKVRQPTGLKPLRSSKYRLVLLQLVQIAARHLLQAYNAAASSWGTQPEQQQQGPCSNCSSSPTTTATFAQGAPTTCSQPVASPARAAAAAAPAPAAARDTPVQCLPPLEDWLHPLLQQLQPVHLLALTGQLQYFLAADNPPADGGTAATAASGLLDLFNTPIHAAVLLSLLQLLSYQLAQAPRSGSSSSSGSVEAAAPDAALFCYGLAPHGVLTNVLQATADAAFQAAVHVTVDPTSSSTSTSSNGGLGSHSRSAASAAGCSRPSAADKRRRQGPSLAAADPLQAVNGDWQSTFDQLDPMWRVALDNSVAKQLGELQAPQTGRPADLVRSPLVALAAWRNMQQQLRQPLETCWAEYQAAYSSGGGAAGSGDGLGTLQLLVWGLMEGQDQLLQAAEQLLGRAPAALGARNALSGLQAHTVVAECVLQWDLVSRLFCDQCQLLVAAGCETTQEGPPLEQQEPGCSVGCDLVNAAQRLLYCSMAFSSAALTASAYLSLEDTPGRWLDEAGKDMYHSQQKLLQLLQQGHLMAVHTVLGGQLSDSTAETILNALAATTAGPQGQVGTAPQQLQLLQRQLTDRTWSSIAAQEPALQPQLQHLQVLPQMQGQVLSWLSNQLPLGEPQLILMQQLVAARRLAVARACSRGVAAVEQQAEEMLAIAAAQAHATSSEAAASAAAAGPSSSSSSSSVISAAAAAAAAAVEEGHVQQVQQVLEQLGLMLSLTAIFGGSRATTDSMMIMTMQWLQQHDTRAARRACEGVHSLYQLHACQQTVAELAPRLPPQQTMQHFLLLLRYCYLLQQKEFHDAVQPARQELAGAAAADRGASGDADALRLRTAGCNVLETLERGCMYNMQLEVVNEVQVLQLLQQHQPRLWEEATRYVQKNCKVAAQVQAVTMQQMPRMQGGLSVELAVQLQRMQGVFQQRLMQGQCLAGVLRQLPRLLQGTGLQMPRPLQDGLERLSADLDMGFAALRRGEDYCQLVAKQQQRRQWRQQQQHRQQQQQQQEEEDEADALAEAASGFGDLLHVQGGGLPVRESSSGSEDDSSDSSSAASAAQASSSSAVPVRVVQGSNGQPAGGDVLRIRGGVPSPVVGSSHLSGAAMSATAAAAAGWHTSDLSLFAARASSSSIRWREPRGNAAAAAGVSGGAAPKSAGMPQDHTLQQQLDAMRQHPVPPSPLQQHEEEFEWDVQPDQRQQQWQPASGFRDQGQPASGFRDQGQHRLLAASLSSSASSSSSSEPESEQSTAHHSALPQHQWQPDRQLPAGPAAPDVDSEPDQPLAEQDSDLPYLNPWMGNLDCQSEDDVVFDPECLEDGYLPGDNDTCMHRWWRSGPLSGRGHGRDRLFLPPWRTRRPFPQHKPQQQQQQRQHQPEQQGSAAPAPAAYTSRPEDAAAAVCLVKGLQLLWQCLQRVQETWKDYGNFQATQNIRMVMNLTKEQLKFCDATTRSIASTYQQPPDRQQLAVHHHNQAMVCAAVAGLALARGMVESVCVGGERLAQHMRQRTWSRQRQQLQREDLSTSSSSKQQPSHGYGSRVYDALTAAEVEWVDSDEEQEGGGKGSSSFDRQTTFAAPMAFGTSSPRAEEHQDGPFGTRIPRLLYGGLRSHSEDALPAPLWAARAMPPPADFNLTTARSGVDLHKDFYKMLEEEQRSLWEVQSLAAVAVALQLLEKAGLLRAVWRELGTTKDLLSTRCPPKTHSLNHLVTRLNKEQQREVLEMALQLLMQVGGSVEPYPTAAPLPRQLLVTPRQAAPHQDPLDVARYTIQSPQAKLVDTARPAAAAGSAETSAALVNGQTLVRDTVSKTLMPLLLTLSGSGDGAAAATYMMCLGGPSLLGCALPAAGPTGQQHPGSNSKGSTSAAHLCSTSTDTTSSTKATSSTRQQNAAHAEALQRAELCRKMLGALQADVVALDKSWVQILGETATGMAPEVALVVQLLHRLLLPTTSPAAVTAAAPAATTGNTSSSKRPAPPPAAAAAAKRGSTSCANLPAAAPAPPSAAAAAGGGGPAASPPAGALGAGWAKGSGPLRAQLSRALRMALDQGGQAQAGFCSVPTWLHWSLQCELLSSMPLVPGAHELEALLPPPPSPHHHHHQQQQPEGCPSATPSPAAAGKDTAAAMGACQQQGGHQSVPRTVKLQAHHVFDQAAYRDVVGAACWHQHKDGVEQLAGQLLEQDEEQQEQRGMRSSSSRPARPSQLDRILDVMDPLQEGEWPDTLYLPCQWDLQTADSLVLQFAAVWQAIMRAGMKDYGAAGDRCVAAMLSLEWLGSNWLELLCSTVPLFKQYKEQYIVSHQQQGAGAAGVSSCGPQGQLLPASCDHCRALTPSAADGGAGGAGSVTAASLGDAWCRCPECRVAMYCSRSCEVAARLAGEHPWAACRQLRLWSKGRFVAENEGASPAEA